MELLPGHHFSGLERLIRLNRRVRNLVFDFDALDCGLGQIVGVFAAKEDGFMALMVYVLWAGYESEYS